MKIERTNILNTSEDIFNNKSEDIFNNKGEDIFNLTRRQKIKLGVEVFKPVLFSRLTSFVDIKKGTLVGNILDYFKEILIEDTLDRSFSLLRSNFNSTDIDPFQFFFIYDSAFHAYNPIHKSFQAKHNKHSQDIILNGIFKIIDIKTTYNLMQLVKDNYEHSDNIIEILAKRNILNLQVNSIFSIPCFNIDKYKKDDINVEIYKNTNKSFFMNFYHSIFINKNENNKNVQIRNNHKSTFSFILNTKPIDNVISQIIGKYRFEKTVPSVINTNSHLFSSKLLFLTVENEKNISKFLTEKKKYSFLRIHNYTSLLPFILLGFLGDYTVLRDFFYNIKNATINSLDLQRNLHLFWLVNPFSNLNPNVLLFSNFFYTANKADRSRLLYKVFYSINEYFSKYFLLNTIFFLLTSFLFNIHKFFYVLNCNNKNSSVHLTSKKQINEIYNIFELTYPTVLSFLYTRFFSTSPVYFTISFILYALRNHLALSNQYKEYNIIDRINLIVSFIIKKLHKVSFISSIEQLQTRFFNNSKQLTSLYILSATIFYMKISLTNNGTLLNLIYSTVNGCVFSSTSIGNILLYGKDNSIAPNITFGRTYNIFEILKTCFIHSTRNTICISFILINNTLLFSAIKYVFGSFPNKVSTEMPDISHILLNISSYFSKLFHLSCNPSQILVKNKNEYFFQNINFSKKYFLTVFQNIFSKKHFLTVLKISFMGLAYIFSDQLTKKFIDLTVKYFFPASKLFFHPRQGDRRLSMILKKNLFASGNLTFGSQHYMDIFPEIFINNDKKVENLLPFTLPPKHPIFSLNTLLEIGSFILKLDLIGIFSTISN